MIRAIARLALGIGGVMVVALFAARAVGSLSHSPLLAYASYFDLYARDLDYDQTIRLTFDGELTIEDQPSWSPDGRALVYTGRFGAPFTSHDPDTDLYWIALNNSRRVELTDNAVNDSVPSWSPDGTVIAYLSDSETARQVKLIAPDDSESEARILPIALPQRLYTTLKWLPDGSGLVLHALDGKKVLPMVYRFTGQTLTPLAAYEAYYPAPSPSGGQIGVTMPTRGGHALAVLTADGSLPRLLTESLPPRIGVVWGDETHLLYLSDDSKSILSVDVQTGQTLTAYRFDNFVTSFALLP